MEQTELRCIKSKTRCFSNAAILDRYFADDNFRAIGMRSLIVFPTGPPLTYFTYLVNKIKNFIAVLFFCHSSFINFGCHVE